MSVKQIIKDLHLENEAELILKIQDSKSEEPIILEINKLFEKLDKVGADNE